MVTINNPFATKEISDEELAKSAPLRTVYRDMLLNAKNNDLPKIKQSLDNFGSGVSKIYGNAISFIDAELKWVKDNIQVSVRDIQQKDTKLGEFFQEFEQNIQNEAKKYVATLSAEDANKIIPKWPDARFQDELRGSINKKEIEKQNEQESTDAEIVNKSGLDFIWFSLNTKMKELNLSFTKIIVITVYLVIGFRLAGFAASELVHKPVGFRILKFIYVFFFWIGYLPFYLYRLIKSLRSNNPEELPRFNSPIPFMPYKLSPDQEISIQQSLFGVEQTPSLQQWIDKKIAEESEELTKVLANKVEPIE